MVQLYKASLVNRVAKIKSMVNTIRVKRRTLLALMGTDIVTKVTLMDMVMVMDIIANNSMSHILNKIKSNNLTILITSNHLTNNKCSRLIICNSSNNNNNSSNSTWCLSNSSPLNSFYLLNRYFHSNKCQWLLNLTYPLQLWVLDHNHRHIYNYLIPLSQ